MCCNDVKRLSAVSRERIDRAALRADERKRRINDRHDNAAEKAGGYGVPRYRGGILNTETAYRGDNDYAEGKPCERIHGIVAVKKTLKHRSTLV